MEAGLRIRVLEGQTRDGRTEYEFPAPVNHAEELIKIGRDPHRCHIAFVDDLRHQGLGNEHVALRRSLGRYQLDLNTQNAVLLDGRKTFEEKELRDKHVLQLGDAVKIEVRVIDNRTATVRETNNRQPHEVTLWNRKLLVGLAATVGAMSLAGWGLKAQQDRLQQANERMAKVVEEAAVPADALERVARSVYLIVARSTAGGESVAGTGWSAPGGVIVTNAHIAEDVASGSDGLHWFVRSSTPPYREHAVTAYRIHPGYKAFREFIAAIKPMQKKIEDYSDVGKAPACDVAILEVDDAGALSPPLPIPTRDELKALVAGSPVAIVGFPEEGLAATPVVMSAPVPVRHRGFLVRVTDFFVRQRSDGMNQLIQHGLPVTGGSSGSPIIDSKGRVIAVHNGGNTLAATDAGRIISQVVSFGQRADFVLDLLENTEAEHLADYRRIWEDSLSDFQREADVRVANHFRETAAILGDADACPQLVEEIPGEAIPAKSAEDLQNVVPIELNLQPGVYSLCVAARDPGNTTDIDTAVVDERSIPVAGDATLSIGSVIQIVNIHPQTYRLVNVVQGDASVVPCTCKVYDWHCDPNDYLGREIVQAVQSYWQTEDPPHFEVQTKAVGLDGTPGSKGRCALEVKINEPGIYVAIGQASKALPFSIGVSGGGASLDANTSPPSEGNNGVFRHSPILVFRVDHADASVRLECMAPVLAPADGATQIEARIFGWPGLGSSGEDG